MDDLTCWQAHMRNGDFELAWRISDRVPPLVWNGSDFCGKPVLVRCDTGLGDAIQFLRYAPMLRERTAAVTVRCAANLVSLLRLIPGVDRAISNCEPPGEYDVAIECTELPYAFRTQLDTIPAASPYIQVPAPPTASGRELRVGLVWAAGPWDPSRSIPLASFEPLADISGVEWVALQHGPALKQARLYGAALGIENTPEPPNDEVLETARVIAGLDLVITVDTMAAHLAGALAKPVWTLLPIDADWRWLRDRDDSPWYPTMRLFRQRRRGHWREVVERVVSTLSNSGPRTPP